MVTAAFEALGEQMDRFEPQVVVCSRPNSVRPGSATTWIEMSLDPHQPTKVCTNGQYSELKSPTLESLVGIMVTTERLIRSGNSPGGC